MENTRPNKKKKIEDDYLEGFLITSSVLEPKERSCEKTKWLGQHLYVPLPFGEKGRVHKVYQGFSKNGIIYKAGDCVLLNCGIGRQPQIGKIKILWSEEKNKYAGIKLFFRLEDTVINRRTTSDQSREIFHPCNDQLVQRHLKMIQGKCSVKYVPCGNRRSVDKFKKKVQNDPEKKLFYYSFWYDEVKGKLYDNPGTRIDQEGPMKKSFTSGGTIDLTAEDDVIG